MNRLYISNTLTHWTGRGKSDSEAFAILKSIIDEKILRLSYCPNYANEELSQKSSMACFTDIPLSQSKEHCSKFGRFGIGFNKTKMMDYGANPAFYTTRTHFERIRTISSLLARMKDLEKDREWKQDSEKYQFTEDETVAMLETVEFLQEYSYRNADEAEYVTYYQREWRITFNSLPFAGDQKPHLPGHACFYVRNGKSYPVFKFDPSDIEYLIVPLRYWLKTLPAAKSIGCRLKIYEFSVRN